MGAGERVDFVPIPKPSTPTTGRAFYLRARGLNDCDDRKNAVHQYAILRYTNATDNVENFPPPSYKNAARNGNVRTRIIH